MTIQRRSDQLEQLVGFVPNDLLAYFDETEKQSLAGLAKMRDVNLLSFDASTKLTTEFLEFQPIIQPLGGIVLDDPNTSNHHFYLSVPPLKGSILYLSHDGDTRVVYPSLGGFIAAVKSVADQEYVEWDEIHPALSPIASDQSQLSDLASKALADSQTEILTAIIPSMDLRDSALLRSLATNRDFFIAEAIAMEIEKRPSVEFQWLADLCAAHPHKQAANAGRRAQARINAVQ